jgi:UDP-N-acetylglucosamine 2-epimerase (non-hydrolysing)
MRLVGNNASNAATRTHHAILPLSKHLHPRHSFPSAHKRTILTLFGTRPEVIKLAPVIHQLEQKHGSFRTVNVASGQHNELLYPLIDRFGLRLDYDLRLMTARQDPELLLRRISEEFSKLVDVIRPDLILIQGDTTTALAGAMVARLRDIPAAHIEAGLRSGNLRSPYPEEMIRTKITRLATYHFAPTRRNRDVLLKEGVAEDRVFVTGNPIVDAVQMMLKLTEPHAAPPYLKELDLGNHKCLVLTTHRRESFGETLAANLQVLRRFVHEHEDVVLVFPVHPNPNVDRPARAILRNHPRIKMIPPLQYGDFIQLLAHSWLIVSDSGGIQEEVPSLGKPLLILRENTERPECVEAGIARLVGGSPSALSRMLEEAYLEGSWIHSVHKIQNPFGNGDSAERIAKLLSQLLADTFAHD